MPAVGLLINGLGQLCVKGYRMDRKSPGMAFVTVDNVAVQPRGVAEAIAQ